MVLLYADKKRETGLDGEFPLQVWAEIVTQLISNYAESYFEHFMIFIFKLLV